MRIDLADALVVVGFLAFVAGLYQWHPMAACIGGGLGLIAGGLALAAARVRRE